MINEALDHNPSTGLEHEVCSRFVAILRKTLLLSGWILHYLVTMEENLTEKIRRSEYPTLRQRRFHCKPLKVTLYPD